MKYWFSALFCFLFITTTVRAEPLISSELPSSRVRDEAKLMSAPAQALLADYLDTLSQVQKTEFYVVILKDKTVAESVKLCDRWQEKWVPTGRGGVFVYSAIDKKYAFTATPDTIHSVGTEKLQTIFVESVQNPPLRQSLDVVISTPILRIVTAITQSQLEESGARFEKAESQASRWLIIACMAGAMALVGWLLCFSKLVQNANLGTLGTNIPPPGMAYRNPNRKSRRSRSRRQGERHQEDENGEAGEPRANDRF